MKISTKYHDQVELKEEDIITFEKGIPGFPEEKKFIILPLSDDEVFSVLQSVEKEYVAFVISIPFHFHHEYDFELDESSLEELDIQSEQDIQVYSILTVQDPFEKTTANLQAPVVVNVKNKKAKQVILNSANYKTKHPIFQKNVKG